MGVIGPLRRQLYSEGPEAARHRLRAGMNGALRDDDEIARLHLDFPVTEPEGASTVEDELDLVRIRVEMLDDIPTLNRHRSLPRHCQGSAAQVAAADQRTDLILRHGRQVDD